MAATAHENVCHLQQKPPKNDFLDADRESSITRLPKVGMQRQTDRQNYDIDAVFYYSEWVPSEARLPRVHSKIHLFFK